MATLKTLTMVSALLLGGVSLAIAQGPPTGGYPPVGGGAAGNPATNPVTSGPPGPGVIPGGGPAPKATTLPTRTRMAHQTSKPTKHPNKMYMSAKGSKHKSKKTSTKGGY